MRPALKSDGSHYYEYVLLYVDDTLVISENAEHIILNEIGKYFEMKEASVDKPEIYLEGRVNEVTLVNGARAWTFNSSQYVQNAVRNVETHLAKKGEKLPARCKAPFTTNYRSELDVSPELGAVDSAYHVSLIGIFRWIVELGRVDIGCEVSIMSSHMALPWQGHLQQLYHMFGYLKIHHNAEIVFDPSDPDIDMSKFERQYWSGTIYGNSLREKLPPNLPTP